jgi:hypothetical protein
MSKVSRQSDSVRGHRRRDHVRSSPADSSATSAHSAPATVLSCQTGCVP